MLQVPSMYSGVPTSSLLHPLYISVQHMSDTTVSVPVSSHVSPANTRTKSRNPELGRYKFVRVHVDLMHVGASYV